MTDFLLLEKISQLNSKNPKPRLLHQKGIAAGGVFPHTCLFLITPAQTSCKIHSEKYLL